MATNSPKTLSTINGNQIYPVTKIENILGNDNNYSINDKINLIDILNKTVFTNSGFDSTNDGGIMTLVFNLCGLNIETRLDTIENAFTNMQTIVNNFQERITYLEESMGIVSETTLPPIMDN